MEYRSIRTSSYTFECLEWPADGPCVLLLHGFPETPHIFDEVAKQLNEEGYYAIAPYLPGYGESPRLNSDSSVVHLTDLAKVLGELSDCLFAEHGPIVLVGHDWGAICAYVTASAHAEFFDRMVTIAVPPPKTFLKQAIFSPAQWWRSSYIGFFQLRLNIPEKIMSANEHQLLSKLCQHWSGKAKSSNLYFDARTEPFKKLGRLKHCLGYYRGLVPLSSGSIRAWLKSYKLATKPFKVPAKILVGEFDQCIPAKLYRGHQDSFVVKSELFEIPGAGHFVPIDQPRQVVNHIVR